MKTDREFLAIDEGHYRLSLFSLGLQFDVDRLRRDRHELIGELAVRCELAGARTFNGVLSVGTFNLSSPTARYTRAKDLQRSANAPELDFAGYLEELCQRVLASERAGQPAILLKSVVCPADEADSTITIHGISIPMRHSIIVFGDGGTGKSTIALAIAGELERFGKSTLVLDWEQDEYENRKILGKLFGDDLPDVKYRRCERPLSVEVDGIAQQVRECAIDYVIADSVAFACDGPPESAEVAQRYFRALRQLRVGSVNVAHITKGENGDKRPFGSAFWHNGARATYYAERASDSTSDEMIVGLFNRKNNLGPLLPPFGLSLNFQPHRIAIGPANLADSDELAAKLPLWARMKGALRRGPKTLVDLSEELGAKVDTVERTMRRHSLVFTRLTNQPDGIHRIALVERRTACARTIPDKPDNVVRTDLHRTTH